MFVCCVLKYHAQNANVVMCCALALGILINLINRELLGPEMRMRRVVVDEINS